MFIRHIEKHSMCVEIPKIANGPETTNTLQPYSKALRATLTGSVEVGVQGVPQLLGKDMFIPEKFGVRYLCAHPIFSGFHRPCMS